MDEKVMFQLGYGLYVLTSKAGKDNGCIINTAMQVTAVPNQIMVAVNKECLTHDMIIESGQLNLSVLTENAERSIYERFGYQSGRTVDKFADYDNMERSANGLYYIKNGCNAYISGKVFHTVALATHTLFLAKVTDGQILNDVPSLTYARYHALIK